MGNFNRGRSGGGGGFNRGNNRGGSGGGGFRGGGGGRGGFGGQRNDRPQMHPATCADCGNRCEVPFRPSGDKPVYCSNCFGNSSNYGSKRAERSGGNQRFDRNDPGPQMHSATCAECGDRCEVPFRPTGERPVLCSHCFKGNSKAPQRDNRRSDERMSFPTQSGGGNSDEVGTLKKEVVELNKKMDKVLTLLQRTNSVKEVTVMKASKASKADKSEAVEAKEEAAPKKKAAKKEVAKKKPAAKKKVAAKAPAKKKAAPKKAAAKKAAPKKKVAKKK